MSHQLQHLMSTILRNRRDQYSTKVLDAAWWYRHATTETGVVLDERPGLGTPRDPQPRRAQELNGTNQYGWIEINPVNAYPFTLFGWARKSNTSLQSFLSVSAASNANKYLTFRMDEGDQVGVLRRNTTEVETNETVAALTDQWVSLLCSFVSATEVQIFRNGALLATLTGLTSVGLDDDFTRFCWGTQRFTTPTNYFAGRVMHVGFLRRAATLGDAEALDTTGIIPDAPHFFTLDNNSTTVSYNLGIGEIPAAFLVTDWSLENP